MIPALRVTTARSSYRLVSVYRCFGCYPSSCPHRAIGPSYSTFETTWIPSFNNLRPSWTRKVVEQRECLQSDRQTDAATRAHLFPNSPCQPTSNVAVDSALFHRSLLVCDGLVSETPAHRVTFSWQGKLSSSSLPTDLVTSKPQRHADASKRIRCWCRTCSAASSLHILTFSRRTL